jgi:hypothetical protein
VSGAWRMEDVVVGKVWVGYFEGSLLASRPVQKLNHFQQVLVGLVLRYAVMIL